MFELGLLQYFAIFDDSRPEIKWQWVDAWKISFIMHGSSVESLSIRGREAVSEYGGVVVDRVRS